MELDITLSNQDLETLLFCVSLAELKLPFTRDGELRAIHQKLHARQIQATLTPSLYDPCLIHLKDPSP